MIHITNVNMHTMLICMCTKKRMCRHVSIINKSALHTICRYAGTVHTHNACMHILCNMHVNIIKYDST